MCWWKCYQNALNKMTVFGYSRYTYQADSGLNLEFHKKKKKMGSNIAVCGKMILVTNLPSPCIDSKRTTLIMATSGGFVYQYLPVSKWHWPSRGFISISLAISIHTSTHIHTYMYIYIHTHRPRDKADTHRWTDKQTHRHREGDRPKMQSNLRKAYQNAICENLVISTVTVTCRGCRLQRRCEFSNSSLTQHSLHSTHTRTWTIG